MWFLSKAKLSLLSEAEIYDSMVDLPEGSQFQAWTRSAQDSEEYEWAFTNILNVNIISETLTKIKFLLKANDTTDDMQLRVQFLSDEADDVRFGLSYDFCVIKLSFMNENNQTEYVRYIHVEPTNKNNSRSTGGQRSGRGERLFGSYFDKSFCPLEDAQKICQCRASQFSAPEMEGVAQVERLEFISLEIDLLVHFVQPFSATGNLQHDGSLLSVFKENSKWIQDAPLRNLSPSMEFGDVVLRVGTDLKEKLTAHKCILAANSPVFKSMLQADMRENISGVIELQDVSPEVMTEFLGFIYGKNPGTCELPPVGRLRSYLELLKVAHRFQVDTLVDHIMTRIIGTPTLRFTVKAALDVYAAGTLYDMPDLKFKSLQCIKQLQPKLATPEGKAQLETFIQAHGPAIYSFILEIYRSTDNE